MGIFERISDLVKSNINDLIDKAEKPEKMVKQIIIDMEEQIKKVTQSLGVAMGSLNQAEKQLIEAQTEKNKWEEKAKKCLEKGNEELARQALEKKIEQEKLVNQYQEMTNTMKGQVDEIKGQIDILKEKLEEARNKQAMLVARSQMADAKTKMAQTLGNIDSNSAFAKIEKMEEKVEKKEAQSNAFSQISGIEEEDTFEKIEKEENINSELERLKKQLNKTEEN